MKTLILAALLIAAPVIAGEAPAPPPTVRELELTKIYYESQKKNLELQYQILEQQLQKVIEELEKRKPQEKEGKKEGK